MGVSKIWDEGRTGYENLLLKFCTTRDIIDKKFICLNEELERVVDLVSQKIDMKIGEFLSDYTEAVVAEERRRDLETKVEELEQRLRVTVVLMSSFSDHLVEVEDIIMEDSDAEGEAVASSSLSDFGPVENMVAIPVPGPSVIHTLTPISDTYIPLSVHSSPSPPYVQVWEEDLVHSGVLEYWAGPDA